MELFRRHGIKEFFNGVPAHMSRVASDVEEKQSHIVTARSRHMQRLLFQSTLSSKETEFVLTININTNITNKLITMFVIKHNNTMIISSCSS